MTLFDDVFAGSSGLAKSLHADYGTAIIIDRSGGTFDRTTGTRTPAGTSQTLTCTPPSRYRAKEIDGTRILASDLKTTVAAADANLTFAPKPGDFASFDSERHEIVDVETVRSGDSVAYYGLQLRGTA